MVLDPSEQQTVQNALVAQSVHPEEIERLVVLGSLPETLGQEMLAVALAGWPAGWLMADPFDGQFFTTLCGHLPAIQLEGRVAAGIGTGAASQYRRLFIGCTVVDARHDADIVHVNVLSEDMRFPALGPRILIDGKTVPFPDDFFDRCEGYHIPFSPPLTGPLLQDLFRTLRSGGVLHYAPSHSSQQVAQILNQEGFVNVRKQGFVRTTPYRGGNTPTVAILVAEKP